MSFFIKQFLKCDNLSGETLKKTVSYLLEIKVEIMKTSNETIKHCIFDRNSDRSNVKLTIHKGCM